MTGDGAGLSLDSMIGIKCSTPPQSDDPIRNEQGKMFRAIELAIRATPIGNVKSGANVM